MTQRAFLSVETSLTGRRWLGPNAEAERLAEAMAQITRLPLALCATLVTRGVAPQDAAAFLAPQLRDLLPDPLRMKDTGRAAARFLHAVKTRQRIAIFADYDVDGGSSAALLIIWLDSNEREIGNWKYVLAGLMALLSYLMVSNLEYPSFKAVNWRTKRSFHWVLVTIFVIAFTVMNWHWMPAVLFVSYLMYGLVRPWVSRKWRQEIEIEAETVEIDPEMETLALNGDDDEESRQQQPPPQSNSDSTVQI